MLLRILRVLLGVPRPSLVAALRHGIPVRSAGLLTRWETRVAARWLRDHPPSPELLAAERALGEALAAWSART